MQRIIPSEYQARIGRATAAMQRSLVDCLVIFPGPNFTYFTGLKFMRERYRAMVALLDSVGNLAMMGPRFEESKMLRGPIQAEVQSWTDEDDQHSRIAEWIRSHCGADPTVGLELTTDFHHFLGLQKALPRAQFVNSKAATDDLRAIKSAAEVACLRAAATRTQVRMQRVRSMLVEGMTEIELADRFGPGAMVQFGLTTASPNAAAGYNKLAARDIIVIDAGDWVEGYRSDLTRTFFFGTPTPRMLEVYKIVNQAGLVAIDAIKPGEPAGIVDQTARRIMARAGFGEHVLHRGGHGIGLAFHEVPICAERSEDVLAPGMVLTVEPGIYLPGEFGVRLEDDVLVTDTGCELLADRSPNELC